MKLKATLDFGCCDCAKSIRVTVECMGPGLSSQTRTTVAVPCPTCGAINRVLFEPGGAVHAVTPAGPRRTLIEPSIN